MELNDRFKFEETPFYFLRHGETPESQRGIVQGQTDTELNANGRRAAERAALRLVSLGLQSIYASPLKRAWQTAKIVSVLTGAPVQPIPGLMERNWGVYEGRHKSERPSSLDPPTAETTEDFSRRIGAAMRSLSGPTPLLVVAHSGVFRVLAQHAGLSVGRATSIESAHCVMFNSREGERRRWRISEISIC